MEGWKNVFWPDPQVEAIAVKRAEICDKCDKVKWIGSLAICSLCNCPIPAKCRSLSERCGDSPPKWIEADV